MGKRTLPKKDHSGVKLYLYNGSKVEVLPYFLYEVTISKYWKNGYAQLGSRFIKSGKLLPIKRTTIVKEYEDYLVEKCISLLGITPNFISENHLKEYKPIVKPRRIKCKKLQE